MEQIFHKLFKNLYFYYLLYYNSWKLIFQIHSLKKKTYSKNHNFSS